jgi:large subunit ribosomal protein L18
MGLRTQKRRRRENKTDYKLRRNLLSSGKPRIVIRRTNKYFILQLVESLEAQDKVVATMSSKTLEKFGWSTKGGLKSIPAGYLTGIAFAKQIKKGEYIVDLGMVRTLSRSRIFSVVKGLIDGGLKIPANEKVFPSEERLMGVHLNEDSQKMIAKVKEAIK